MFLSKFPRELIYEIFNYFSCNEIVQSFYSIDEYLNEIIGQLVLCTGLFKISFFSVSILFSLGVNVKSQLPSTISHIIKRTLANRKEIITKTNQFTKQINAINELYSKLNTQIQNIFIEQPLLKILYRFYNP